MHDKRKAMVMASFAADALALGVHWIYDIDEIYENHGTVDAFLKPAGDSYHPTREKGDFTHYGDQTMVLLQSVAARGGFDLEDFSLRWRKLFADYRGYVDGATRKTLAWYAKGKDPGSAGSHSNDFSGAARIAPLAYRFSGDEAALVIAARMQTKMTHNDPATIDTAEFFARTAFRVLGGTSPVEAMEAVAAMETFELSPISMWVEQGIKSRSQESIPVIGRFGQACAVNQVFSGVVHLIAKYQGDLEAALVQSVMAGGDSAARGIVVGMVLGAHQGMEALPVKWVDALNRKEEIIALLDEISRGG
jgi:ADP-ribosylglycohydrolase